LRRPVIRRTLQHLPVSAAQIRGSARTYSVNGRQYVVIATGGGAGARNASTTEAGREKSDASYVFTLAE
jgi:hypothetical protein